MACWSPENATKAYLQALKMGKRGKEPDVAEFISAIAAGNNARLMVMMACSSIAVSTALALVAAAHQTRGRVVCILLSGPDDDDDDVHASDKKALGRHADCIEFVKDEGDDAERLLISDYKGADFVLIDCNIDGHSNLFRAAKESVKQGPNGGGVVVGYNALHNKGSWSEFNKAHFLPIGKGLLVTRIVGGGGGGGGGGGEWGGRKRSRWVVTVDKCTGEEHVFRITSSSSPQNGIEAK